MILVKQMSKLDFEKMQELQKELQDKYIEKWGRPFSGESDK